MDMHSWDFYLCLYDRIFVRNGAEINLQSPLFDQRFPGVS